MKTRCVLAVGCLVCLIALAMQGRALSRLRHEVEALRMERTDLVAAPPDGPSLAPSPQKDEREHGELLRLRDEVRRLREQIALLKPGPRQTSADEPRAPAEPVSTREEEVRQLGLRASSGDASALEKLAELSNAAARARTNDHQDTHREIRAAFKALGEEAGKGNETAFEALWRATRMKGLEGVAITGLGQAAAMGNEQALERLLDPERYLLLPSSCTGALIPAAERGEQRAIEALAGVAADPNRQALWYLAASGLGGAAGTGNPTAIDALTTLGAAENRSVRESALKALENAAAKQQTRATEALRALGYR